MRLSQVAALSLAALTLVALFAACGDDDDGDKKDQASSGGGTVLNVTGDEWNFKADKDTVPAGDVTIVFTNKGKIVHELAVYTKQDISARLAEKVAAKKQGTKAALGDSQAIKGWVDELEDVDPGTSKTMTVKLTPGVYELGCLAIENTSEGTFSHHEKQMYTTLTVK